MYNDFVLVGPKSDPAKVAGGKDAVQAFQKIRKASAPFVSRGDRSGTHFAELEIWQAAGIDIAREKGRWYRETGQGMGPALNTAAGMNAYVLADRGTWLSFKNRADLAIVVEGDKRLLNPYGIILVNPARHLGVKREMGQAFIDWMISSEGQDAIASYKIGGAPLFFPHAGQ
jgi:tungstate transport system substrate-binding protein